VIGKEQKQTADGFGVRIAAAVSVCVILSALKTSISIPDHLFRLAEAAARKLKMSRSQLYATALAEFIERRKTGKVTERLNSIYSRESSELDPAFQSAQTKFLESDPW
jgi:metal-responsive CopG/Arc/MetJ family transcriptional regulator